MNLNNKILQGLTEATTGSNRNRNTTRKIVLEDKSGNKFEIEYKTYGNIGKIYDGKILNCPNKFNAEMLFFELGKHHKKRCSYQR